LIIIAAVAQNNVIGKNGKIPWNSKEELAFFKETTMGFPVIMGRKTFESIGRPLQGRLNLIITTHPELFIKFEEVKCFFSLGSAVDYCQSCGSEKVFIAGGSGIYNEAINLADELIISRMMFNSEGDTFFPEINPDKWIPVVKEPKQDFEINIYKRKVNDRKTD
jgi:dihydrofolate reductase